MSDQTHQVLSTFRRQRRRGQVGIAAIIVAIAALFVCLATLAQARVEPPQLPPPRDDVDVVSYCLTKSQSLEELAWELWESEVSAAEVLPYNPQMRSSRQPLDAGTCLRLPNFRDFPVEVLGI